MTSMVIAMTEHGPPLRNVLGEVDALQLADDEPEDRQ